MNIFTYYEHVPEHNHESELRLLTLWREHHERLGFEPFVLQPYHAKKHPHYANIHEAVLELPSINPRGYDVACFDRWIAMAVVAGGFGIMSDYDLFLTPVVWDDILPLTAPTGADMQHLRVFQRYCPCLVAGTGQTFLQWAIEFSRYKPAPGLKHTSDQNILAEFLEQRPGSFTSLALVKGFGEQYWNTAPAVHFANSTMEGHQPRYKHIPQLLEQHSYRPA